MSWEGLYLQEVICFPPVILGSLASSHVLSVPSTESNEFNNTILPATESFLQDTHSHLKGKSSPLATIFSDMSLASCAVDWSRLECLTKQNRACSFTSVQCLQLLKDVVQSVGTDGKIYFQNVKERMNIN